MQRLGKVVHYELLDNYLVVEEVGGVTGEVWYHVFNVTPPINYVMSDV